MYNYNIIKKIWSQYKHRIILIACATIFLVGIFLSNTTISFENLLFKKNRAVGLEYDHTTVADAVNKDTDGDGIPDWEESLYGTDPTKKETTAGTPDKVAIERLKNEQSLNNGLSINTTGDEHLTETDKFSREFFTTVNTLNQNGKIDQTTIDKISNSLSDQIKNSVPRKIYTLNDIKIINDDKTSTIKKYNNDLSILYPKNPPKTTVIDILQRFEGDGNNLNTSVLLELDPIIKQTNTLINGMLKISPPKTLSTLHLDTINGLERVLENLNDIKLYDTDVIISLKGITQYYENTIMLTSAVKQLSSTINKKLNYHE